MNSLKHAMAAAWSDFRTGSAADKCDKLAFLCLCAFLFDCSFAGGGHYLSIGPLTPRMLFALLALVFSVPKLLKGFRRYITNPILLLFAAFLIYLVICAVRGYLAGNRMNVLTSDLKGFAWLFLVPVFVASVDTRARFDKLLSCIMGGAVMLSCIVLAVNCVCSFVTEGVLYFVEPFYRIQIGTVSNISYNIFRIFMNSCPYMIIACGIAVFRQVREKKIKVRYAAVIALCLCAVLLSFTRSVYGCAFVVAGCAVVAVICIYYKQLKKMAAFLAVTLAATAALVFVLEFTFDASYLNFALSRTFGIAPADSVAVQLREKWDGLTTAPAQQATDAAQAPAAPTEAPAASTEALAAPTEAALTDELLNAYLNDGDRFDEYMFQQFPGENQLTVDEFREKELERQQLYMQLTSLSDSLRQQTQSELMALIKSSPVFGNGLGAHAPSRVTGSNPASDGLDELFYLDVLARMGIVGLILYLLPFGYLAVYCVVHLKKLKTFPGGIAMLCGMLGFWAVTWFNPWMNAALGIAGYGLCCALPKVIRSEQ